MQGVKLGHYTPWTCHVLGHVSVGDFSEVILCSAFLQSLVLSALLFLFFSFFLFPFLLFSRNLCCFSEAIMCCVSCRVALLGELAHWQVLMDHGSHLTLSWLLLSTRWVGGM